MAIGSSIVPQNFTAPGVFPTSVFTKYYNNPTATSVQHEVYPFALTNPDTIPHQNTVDPQVLPPVASSSKIYSQALQQIGSVFKSTTFGDNNCARCLSILEVLKFVALAAPEHGPDLYASICNTLNLSSTCEATYGKSGTGLGAVITQVAANMDAGGYDGQVRASLCLWNTYPRVNRIQAFCQNFLGMCPAPPTATLDLTNWFKKAKPKPLPTPRKPSGKRLKVLHISDFHLDPSTLYALLAELLQI
ncbi:hypothetical protein H0H87_006469 [Tephrocybe sp. NHM501043]|nr:hypothetical protein H0H87_006469 [Tephrocybe sp. NHM501043]